MSEFKGTQGPWVVDEESFVVTDSSGGFVAEFDYGRWGEDHKNADLIAAAPELLEALQDIVSGWQYIRSQHGDLYGVGWDRAEQKAVSAIAKALGQ